MDRQGCFGLLLKRPLPRARPGTCRHEDEGGGLLLPSGRRATLAQILGRLLLYVRACADLPDRPSARDVPGCPRRVVHGDVRAGLDDPLVAGCADEAGGEQLASDEAADKLGKLLLRAACLPPLLEPKRGDAKHFGCGRPGRWRPHQLFGRDAEDRCELVGRRSADRLPSVCDARERGSADAGSTMQLGQCEPGIPDDRG